MSPQIIGRRLLLGGSIGALVPLAPRVARADTSFTSFAFPATGAPTPRTMPDRLAEVVNVKDYGAVGNGTKDDTTAIQDALNAAFGSPSAPNGRNTKRNKPVFFPAGAYLITVPLELRSVVSGHIFGAGRQTSLIFYNTGSHGNVINTNGFEYSRVENMGFVCASDGHNVCFNLDWDNTGAAALQANSFIDCAFGGGDYGALIGASGFMGSENLFLNCHFTHNKFGGIRTCNFNALDQSVIGGGVSGCATLGGAGLWTVTGSIPVIQNVAFAQGNSAWDIRSDTNGINAVIGCRTESRNFINASGGTWHISSCDQSNNANGYFINNLNGSCSIHNCQSLKGEIDGYHGFLDLRSNTFVRADYLDKYKGATDCSSHASVRENYTVNKALSRGFSGKTYSNAGASGPIVYTLPNMMDNDPWKPGIKFRFYVAAAQPLTIAAQNNMTIRAGSSVSAGSGNITSNSVGSFIELECIDGDPAHDSTTWVVNFMNGSWTVK